MEAIYVLGNEAVEDDSSPVRMLPKLQRMFPEIRFIRIDPTENLPEDERLVLIDTVANANGIIIIKDIDSVEKSPSYTLHDFDLGIALKIMKKLGKVKEVAIIGIPANMDEGKALEKLKRIIPSALSGNVKRS